MYTLLMSVLGNAVSVFVRASLFLVYKQNDIN